MIDEKNYYIVKTCQLSVNEAAAYAVCIDDLPAHYVLPEIKLLTIIDGQGGGELKFEDIESAIEFAMGDIESEPNVHYAIVEVFKMDVDPMGVNVMRVEFIRKLI